MKSRRSHHSVRGATMPSIHSADLLDAYRVGFSSTLRPAQARASEAEILRR